MTASFTPGPWTQHESMRDCVTFKGRNGIENLFLQNVDGYFACQNENDASVIAAALDMYEALKKIDGLHPNASSTTEWNAAFMQVSAAIAKAEGTAP